MARQVNQQGQGGQENKALALQQKYKNIAGFLGQSGVLGQIGRALPKHMSADRLVRVALISISKTPKLLQCTPESLAKALTECSSYGLEPNGRDIHLVPFWNNKKGVMEVQVIPDYKGLVQLMYRSGLVVNVQALAVRRKDEFDYKFGTGAFVSHKPADEDDRGPLTYAWAMAELKGGGSPFVVLNKSQVVEHMKKSQSSNFDDSPWKLYPDAMWAKTALRVLSKFVPKSAELADALARDDDENTVDGEAVLLGSIEESEEQQTPPQTKSERLAQQVTGDKTPPPEDQQEDDTVDGAATEAEPPEQGGGQAGGNASATMMFLDMLGKATSLRDCSAIDDYFFGPQAQVGFDNDEKRFEASTLLAQKKEQFRVAAEKKAEEGKPKKGGQQRTLT